MTARRHLTVTEAEYVALSRFALTAADADGRPLGKGGASWFLARCLAGLEARNRALWVAQHALAAGRTLSSEQLRLLREAAGADRAGAAATSRPWRHGPIPGTATWEGSHRSWAFTGPDAPTGGAGPRRRLAGAPAAG